MARPSIRTPDLIDRLVRLLQEGKPFSWFNSEDARGMGLPSTETIRRWRIEDTGFDALCARACESHAEADYDRMEELEGRALLPKNDAQHLDPYAVSVVLGNARWRMERRAPKRYGQKIEHSGHLSLEQLVVGSAKPTTESDQ